MLRDYANASCYKVVMITKNHVEIPLGGILNTIEQCFALIDAAKIKSYDSHIVGFEIYSRQAFLPFKLPTDSLKTPE